LLAATINFAANTEQEVNQSLQISLFYLAKTGEELRFCKPKKKNDSMSIGQDYG
jgi:hypothetical protein